MDSLTAILLFTWVHQDSLAKQVNAAKTLLHMDAKPADTTEQDATFKRQPTRFQSDVVTHITVT